LAAEYFPFHFHSYFHGFFGHRLSSHTIPAMRRGGTVRNRGKAETARGDSPRGAISCQALFCRQTLDILSLLRWVQQTTVVAIVEHSKTWYDFCSPGRFMAANDMNTTPRNVTFAEF
jgi:hypothetical protein